MKRALSLVVLAATMTAAIFPPSAWCAEKAPAATESTTGSESLAGGEWETVKDSGISMRYPKACFTRARVVTLKKLLPEPGDIPEGTGPRRWEIELAHTPRNGIATKKGQDGSANTSSVYITPLKDDSVKNFNAAYPELAGGARDMRLLLKDPKRDFGPWLADGKKKTPAGLPKELPSVPWLDAARELNAKCKVLEFPRVRGLRVLAYYRQDDDGTGATNAELTYDFQGLSNDGQYYVSAHLAVRNPNLPDSVDDPKAKMTPDSVAAKTRERQRINSWGDETFFPALGVLDEMIGSITIVR